MGILLKSAVSAHYFHPSWKGLPAPLVSAVRKPPLPTTWVPTVLTDAVFCLVADTFYPTREAMVRWSYDRTSRLANLPMYSALTRLAGIERFLKMAVRFHALFQRGTELTLRCSDRDADVLLEHPPHLHGELNHLSNEGVFRAALESAGGREVKVELVRSEPTHARYRASWAPATSPR